jgi:hypothetical protein
MDDSAFLGFKKLVSRKDAEALCDGDEDKLKHVKEAASDAIRVFEPGNGQYSETKDQVVIREIYWRKSRQYPEGWYCVSTRSGVLSEGPLPGGIFPIVTEGCIDQPTSARPRSPIKDLRPYQIEINRAASKVAEHQITLGDDKIITPNGSNITQGASLPGIRTYKTSGAAPIILEGRSGAQYQEYVTAKIAEMYSVAMLQEILEDNKDSQQDPYAMLFKSLRQKKRFSLYADKFECFIVKYYELILETQRFYLPEDEIIPMISKNEAVNIEEFKNQEPIHYQIKVSPMSDDVETMMGKQLIFAQTLQYVGPNMTRNDIGKIMTEMPFLPEGKRIFSDLVIDEENANNLILQLDRGKMPALKPGLNKEYTLTRITSRMNKSDYDFIAPEHQLQYDIYVEQLQQAITEELQAKQALQAEFIPAQGFLTPCDFYVPDPANPEKTRRARLPIDALGWLVKRLEEQGNSLERLEQLQGAAQGSLANQALSTMQGASAQQAIGIDEAPELQGGASNGTTNRPTADDGLDYSGLNGLIQ